VDERPIFKAVRYVTEEKPMLGDDVSLLLPERKYYENIPRIEADDDLKLAIERSIEDLQLRYSPRGTEGKLTQQEEEDEAIENGYEGKIYYATSSNSSKS